MKIRFIPVLCCFFFVSINLASAGDGDLHHRQIKWGQPVEVPVTEQQTIKVIHFEGALMSEDNVPFYFENIPLTGSVTSVKVEIENALFEPVKETDLLPKKSPLGNEISVSAKIGYRKKQPFAGVSFFPLRKSSTGIIERLTSFDLKITPLGYSAAQRIGARSYTHSSVLKNGSWYKISVTQDGIYKLDYGFLKSIGIDVDNIDPRNLKIFGNGGGMLPYANSISRYDDLQENAIYVEGESDGHFNQGDYILFYGQAPTRWTYNSSDKKFHHQVHFYSDSTYYFINADMGTGKRIQQQNSTGTPTNFVNTFDDYSYHEADLVNLLKSGREWYG